MNKSRYGIHWRLATLLVIIPIFVAILYFAFFAKSRYVSTAEVVIRQAGSNNLAQQTPGLSLLLGGINPASREETLHLRQFINSADMLAILQERLKWSEHYAGQWRDPLYWLSPEASREDVMSFYRRLVTANFDELTGLLTVQVQALTPEFSKEILSVILAESERFVNELSHRMARDQMGFAELELATARKNYEARREDMIQFQNTNNILNAEATAESRAVIVADLESKLTLERANLTALLATLNNSAPQVHQQRIRINALSKQLDIEKARLVSAPDGGQLNVVAARYRNLTLDTAIAEEAYKLSVSAFENARIEASKKVRSLVVVVKPNLPDDAIYPRTLYNLFTIMIALILVYGIARFIMVSIEDHRD